MNSTLMPSAKCCSSHGPSLARSMWLGSATTTTRCGLPMSTVAARVPGRSAPARKASTSVGMAGPTPGRAHLHADGGGSVVVGLLDLKAPDPRVGGHVQHRLVDAARGDQCLAQAADAVAAHLGPATVGVEQVHHHVDVVCRSASGRRSTGRPVDQPVGADPGRRSHRRTARAPSIVRPATVDLVEHDEEVVGQAVVLRELHRISLPAARRCRPRHCARPAPRRVEGHAGTTAAGGGRSAGSAGSPGRRPRPASSPPSRWASSSR